MLPQGEGGVKKAKKCPNATKRCASCVALKSKLNQSLREVILFDQDYNTKKMSFMGHLCRFNVRPGRPMDWG